jgi:hypothetical protein
MPPPERNSDEAQLQTSRTTPLPFAAFCSKIGADTNTAITSTSGALSGFAATFAKQPIQRVKWIRQVGEGGSPIPYRTILKDTVQKLGFRGFFNGSVAAIYRNVPHSMISFTLYPKFERYVLVLQGGALWMFPKRFDRTILNLNQRNTFLKDYYAIVLYSDISLCRTFLHLTSLSSVHSLLVTCCGRRRAFR